MTATLLATLSATALLALAGGLHCAAMCGGLAATFTFAIPDPQRRGARLWYWQGLLGAGRVLTYSLLGALAGALGGSLLARLGGGSHLHWPALLSGVLMILLAAHLLGLSAPMRALERIGARVWRRLSPLTRPLLPLDHPLKALALGALWGFLPCGLLYSALLLAAATGSAPGGALAMAVFGLVTLAPVASTGVFAGQISRLRQKPVKHLAAAMSLGVAMLFFWQGLAAAHMNMPVMPGGVERHHHGH